MKNMDNFDIKELLIKNKNILEQTAKFLQKSKQDYDELSDKYLHLLKDYQEVSETLDRYKSILKTIAPEMLEGGDD